MTPIYAATVADLGFDPATVSPIVTEAERHALHAIWWEDVLRRSTLPSVLTPKKRRTRKAAS